MCGNPDQEEVGVPGYYGWMGNMGGWEFLCTGTGGSAREV